MAFRSIKRISVKVTFNLLFSGQVRAVKFGHVLVVDEADKAPTNVTCILKSLVEKGEMILGDGRRIVSGMKFCLITSLRCPVSRFVAVYKLLEIV